LASPLRDLQRAESAVMAIDTFVKPMLKLEIFQGLRPLQITEIARRAYRVVYKPGDIIMREDDEGDAAVVIVSGEAVRISGPAMSEPAEAVPPGAMLGEMAMLIETRHSSTIIARTHVRALRIAREDLQAQMAEDSALADHFVQRITARLSAVLDSLKAIDAMVSDDAGVASAARHSGGRASLHAHVH
jgi:CRP-like cAMP-binding protein